MKITIYQNSGNGKILANTYDLALGEFERFSKEFLNYLKAGDPVYGVYRQVMAENYNNDKQIKDLPLCFAEIAKIEA